MPTSLQVDPTVKLWLLCALLHTTLMSLMFREQTTHRSDKVPRIPRYMYDSITSYGSWESTNIFRRSLWPTKVEIARWSGEPPEQASTTWAVAALSLEQQDCPFTQARWWFQTYLRFSPLFGEDFQFELYFSDGWFNHQLGRDFLQIC